MDEPRQVRSSVTVITCAVGSQAVERTLVGLEGVAGVDLNLATDGAVVDLAASSVSVTPISLPLHRHTPPTRRARDGGSGWGVGDAQGAPSRTASPRPTT